MKEAGETSANPLKESFTYPGNKRRLFVALFGLAAGLTVIWYTAMYGALFFLTGPQRMENSAAELVVGAGALAGLFWFVFFGWLSDRVGRKKRSEERRVGKEGVSTCRSRGSRYP